MKTLTQPLKIFGGKGAFNGKLAKWIMSMMPPRDTWHLFSESHFGGGAVSFAMDPEGISELHNDIHGGLMNFWDVLKHPKLFAKFKRLVEATPFAQPAFIEADRWTGDMTEDAVLFFVRARQSRAGQMKDFATTTARTRRGMNENVSAWLNAIDGLPEVHTRVKRMEFRCMDGTEFVRKFDHPRRLVLCRLALSSGDTDGEECVPARNEHASPRNSAVSTIFRCECADRQAVI